MVFLFPFSSNAQEQVKRIFGSYLTVFSSFQKEFNKFFSPLYSCFSASSSSLVSVFLPPSLVVPANLLHTFFCHGLSYFQHALTLFSFLGFKRDACSWIEGLLFEKEGGVLLHVVGQILGRSKGHALSLSPPPCIYTPLNEVGCLGLV